MNILDSKTISTQYGLEIYLDSLNHVEITELRIPTSENPYFDMKIGIKHYCLKEENYYYSDINYFGLRIHPEKKSIKLLELDCQSLFGVKTKAERAATKALIGEWLIRTNTFKQSIKEIINEKKEENVTTEEEIHKTMRIIELLKKALEIKTEDILKATLEKVS